MTLILQIAPRIPIIKFGSEYNSICVFKDVSKNKYIKGLLVVPVIVRTYFLQIRVLTAQYRLITFYCPSCLDVIRHCIKGLAEIKDVISNTSQTYAQVAANTKNLKE